MFFFFSIVQVKLSYNFFLTFQNTVFSNITYALIGDDTMPSYFTLNSISGQISVRASLTAEIRDSYQGRIVAFDGGSPPRSATAIATINIQRNLNSPIFNPSSYEETILETLQAGTSILRVTASDSDRSVSGEVWLKRNYTLQF